MKDRVGFYCWAGPDTIRMIKLKFFNPKIDEKSLMSSYDLDYLTILKEKFGITDFWASYSWGFSTQSEKAQHEFTISKLENFKKVGMKVHAYVQGTNVVYEDYKNKDWYCKDEFGRYISYYRGRRVVCVNNPGYVEYMVKKIQSMYGLGFDGIYVDNIQMGQIPIPDFDGGGLFTFAGCSCEHCNKKFFGLYKAKIPTDMKDVNGIRYYNFRIDSILEFITKLSEVVHKGGMEFGTNSYDPKFDTKLLFGTDLKGLDKLQDYLLFENHSLPTNRTSNAYINDLIHKYGLKKPVFVVSYKRGIGLDSEFSQIDFNNIYSEDKRLPFNACIKGSEYVTNGVWHNLRLEDVEKPVIDESKEFRPTEINTFPERMILKVPYIKSLLRKYYNPLFKLRMERKYFRKFMYFLARIALD